MAEQPGVEQEQQHHKDYGKVRELEEEEGGAGKQKRVAVAAEDGGDASVEVGAEDEDELAEVAAVNGGDKGIAA